MTHHVIHHIPRRVKIRIMLRTAHRWCGLTAALGVIWIAVTGLLLQLSDELQFPHRYAPDWVQAVYGAPGPQQLASNHISIMAKGPGIWTINQVDIQLPFHRLHAITPTSDTTVAALFDEGVVWLDAQGRLVETQAFDQIAPGQTVLRTSVDQRGVCLRTEGSRLLCSRDGLNWTGIPANATDRGHDHEHDHPVDQTEPVSMEHWLVDLHQGRFFGVWGRVASIVFAVCLLILAVTGSWVALSKPKRHVHH